MSETERKVNDLHVHPHNLRIYGEPDDGLKDSLEQFGLQHAIHITPDGGILSGARRWTAARALEWDAIPVEVVDLTDDADVRKYVLLANAYRKAKPSWMQKVEADEYLSLLSEGVVSKDELRGIAMENGEGGAARSPLPWREDKPVGLAAMAAGMHRTTYQNFRYVADDNGAKREIDLALTKKEIAPQQASVLKRELNKVREQLKSDAVGAKKADNTIRAKIRDAKVSNTYSDAERRQRDADLAVVEVNKKGRAFLNAIEMLKSEGHADHLDERHAMVLANTVSEIVETVRGMQTHGRIEGKRGRNVEIVA